jgi:hypothetical protein
LNSIKKNLLERFHNVFLQKNGRLVLFVTAIFLTACSSLDMASKRPQVSCSPLGEFAPGDWKSVEAAFAKSPEISLGQSWRKQQDRFRPALVRTGWRDDMLWVYAEIEDVDVFNAETRFNEPFFMKGDAFEIFLRPVGQAAYFEFHVGPSNQLFQLRIPSAKAFAKQSEGESESWKIRNSVVKSWSAVDQKHQLWRVLVAIPFQAVVEKGGSRSQWLFSFARYDYTRDENGPILSSSSPHAKLGFHRQQEWGRIRFDK